MPLPRHCRKVMIMKRAWIVPMSCVVLLFLCVAPCLADAGIHPPAYVESKPGTSRILCASELKGNMLPQTGYIGIWADASRILNSAYPAQYATFDAWIWCLPSENGLQAAEFAVSFPATVVTLVTVQQPNITVALGTLAGGISVAFGEGQCQMDWVWMHHLTMMQLGPPSLPTEIEIIPHPGTLPVPAYQAASCKPGYPIEPLIYYSPLYINQSGSMCGDDPAPVLTNMTVESHTVIHAFLDIFTWTGLPTENHFFLRDKANPTDTIRCISAVRQPNGNEFVLTLEHPMVDNTTYILKAWRIYSGVTPGDSELEFLFLEVNATLLQSCSAALGGSGVEIAWELSEVDAGIAFFVSRSEGGADFVPLDMSRLARNDLTFTYVDSRIEPAKGYVYKVEYTIGGKSRLLFISEEIRTPAALLALEQNRPNPFNPSTTISFTLPVESEVRLEVYDVSGRLVARLIDGARQGAGPHNVEWNGRDASGRAAASGIYVYRLVAGKEMISRKMVLLR
jgi:hypothetical protein